MAWYAIGDIQGCMDSLERLLARIDFQPDRDRLWLVGDLVNRGPRSLEVVRWAMAQGDAVTAVLGNHDLHLLARLGNIGEDKRRDTLDAILAAPDREAITDWLRRRPLLAAVDEFVLVHAGLHPQWRVEEARGYAAELEANLRGDDWRQYLTAWWSGPTQPFTKTLVGSARARALLAYFIRVRTCFEDGTCNLEFDGPPAQAPKHCKPWFAFPDAAWRDHTVLFGHWAALGLHLGDRAVGLDTGCVWGRQLTAMRLPDRTLFQVKSVETAS